MKIMLAHKFHYMTGGAEVFYFQVARVLKEKGHTVSFFTTEAEENIATGFPNMLKESWWEASVFQ